MGVRSLALASGLIVFLWAQVALAEEGVELWQSPLGTGWAVSVNPADGSCWAGTGASVMHLAADGRVLSHTNGFTRPSSLSVNSVDGSCWVADEETKQVVHLAEDATELWRRSFGLPSSVCVNPADGSCWVADHDNDALVHLAADGGELRTIQSPIGPSCVAVDPTDGSCWSGSAGGIIHIAADARMQEAL